MGSSRSDGPPPSPVEALGDETALRLLQELVATAPTNLEDPGHQRYEKPNYRRASDAIVRWARSFGLATRVFDPTVSGPHAEEFGDLPRPNVVADLERGGASTLLVMAHYDVVPVPAEQRARWKSPPHTLTLRADGRLYARGANDDLGSGVVATLLALRRLADADRLPMNVRLLACCDEETGGDGGIEAIRAHDAELAPGDPERLLDVEAALIPDGSPETTAGSSGVAFLDAGFDEKVALQDATAYGQALVALQDLARTWRSAYPSPDWPDRNAPEPVLTGRASVTNLDFTEGEASPGVRLVRAHAESEAANQIARAVTLVFDGPAGDLANLAARLTPLVEPPFSLEKGGVSSVEGPTGSLRLQLVGQAAHGGYPHRGHNPVPAALRLLDGAIERGILDGRAKLSPTWAVDLRLTPEMELDDGLDPALARIRGWAAAHAPAARIAAPPSRCRPGYSLPVDHPLTVKLDRLVREHLGGRGIFGEYGGTDASSLRGLMTPRGEPLPALVFGSMDPSANIHDAEESVDPRLLAGVSRTIERFVREP